MKIFKKYWVGFVLTEVVLLLECCLSFGNYVDQGYIDWKYLALILIVIVPLVYFVGVTLFEWYREVKELEIKDLIKKERSNQALQSKIEYEKLKSSVIKLDYIITKQLDKSDNQVECQTLKWVLDKMSEVIDY